MKKEFGVSALLFAVKVKRSASRLTAGAKNGTEQSTIHGKSESYLSSLKVVADERQQISQER